MTFLGLANVPQSLAADASPSAVYSVGVAKHDVTPDYPVRLSGFAFRKSESEGISQRLWARALAIGTDEQRPVVLVTLDSLGIRQTLVDEVARRLARTTGLTRSQLIVTFTHTHCAPKVNGAADNIFAEPIPAEHQTHLDRYTEELTAGLVSVVEAALADRQPATLSWGVGQVDFAMNRRTPGGPVEHALPCLIARSATEPTKIRAIYTSYACHCVTLSHNLLSGDWAGYAVESLERHFPGVVGMVSIGCGSDQNPNSGVTGDKIEVAVQQGMQIGDEVARLVADGSLRPLSAPLSTSRGEIELPFQPIPTRAEFELMKAAGGAAGYNATTQLARLERGDTLPKALAYPIQECHFGDQLCMVFLAGEVCVDYALRLRRELDAQRLWVHGYSHDFGAYIPSERLLAEGGYGAGAEIPYFALPAKLASGLEQRIVDEIHRLVPDEYRPAAPRIPAAGPPADEAPAEDATTEKPPLSGTQGIPPLSPRDALEAFQTHPQLQVQLVASEPQVVDPVAIDFGPDGQVWVVQMVDYGHGIEEEFAPRGEVRILRDANDDGSYETAQVFLDGLRYPTDVKVWRDGVLVCDAPDILFARDRDGDGRADTREVLFTGFETHNGQARVNSLQWGLDNWLYGSGGLFGGRITSRDGTVVDVSGRDFRIQPDLGLIEPVTGRSQQGRVRDDWGNWFGCDNSTLLRHYPIEDRYARRNPFVVPPAAAVYVPGGPHAGQLYPASDLVLFRLSGAPGRATAACGVGIYRDSLLGADYAGNSFTCEPVNQLVYRQILSRSGAVIRGQRAANEEAREFLSSSDRWFRPVQARTGPDGGLWIVDMYRFVIEHPKWIPDETLAELDVFAGQGMGRIYRVMPAGKALPPRLALSHLNDQDLARSLDSRNGTIRDLVHQLLLWRGAESATAELLRIAEESQHPAARIQALAVLDGLQQLPSEALLTAMNDPHAEVRRQAVRIAESFVANPGIAHRMLELADDDAFEVRLQVANSMAGIATSDASGPLTKLATESSDPYLQSAALCALTPSNVGSVAELVLADDLKRERVGSEVVTTAAGIGDPAAIAQVLRWLLSREDRWQLWQIEGLSQLLDGLDRRAAGGGLVFSTTGSDERLAEPPPATAQAETISMPILESQREAARSVFLAARQLLPHADSSDEQISAALKLLGRRAGPATAALLGQTDVFSSEVAQEIAELIDVRFPSGRQIMAVQALARRGDAAGGQALLTRLDSATPQVRAAIVQALLQQPAWDAATRSGLQAGTLTPLDFNPDTRQQFLERQPSSQRAQVESWLAYEVENDREALVAAWSDVAQLQPDPQLGQALFARHCSSCHKFNDVGFEVGPDLAALTSRSTPFLLTAILHPNRDVDARYQSFQALLDDGRLVAGQMLNETATSITLLEQGAKQHVVLRNQLVQLRATGRSAMPEGLEKELSKQDLANIIAYIQGADSEAYQLSRQVLDDNLPREQRESLIAERPQLAAQLITALTADLPHDTAEEYRRIPWIWRVAIAAGKRNQSAELLEILDVSLPQNQQPLRDWQAVVVGGGVINGVSQAGSWPLDRIQRLISGNGPLVARWNRAIALASVMADDENVRAGTRYDALRMVALANWAEHGEQLASYLTHENSELQMGAISGLSDMPAAEAGRSLVFALPQLTGRNRELAVDALLRTAPRTRRLLTAIQAGEVAPTALGDKHVEQLLEHPDESLQQLASELLQPCP